MKEIMLKKCETDIACVKDCLGNIIGFTKLYEDKEKNMYELFFSATIEDEELEINLENDNWESVADWEKPLEIFMVKGFNDEKGSIAYFMEQKYGRVTINQQNLLDLGCKITSVGTDFKLTV